MSSRSVTENHALVAVPVALIIQAMAKMIAATMASMPICFPYRAGIIGVLLWVLVIGFIGAGFGAGRLAGATPH